MQRADFARTINWLLRRNEQQCDAWKFRPAQAPQGQLAADGFGRTFPAPRLQDVGEAREDLAGVHVAGRGAGGVHVAHHVVAQALRQLPVAHKLLRALHLRRMMTHQASKLVVVCASRALHQPPHWIMKALVCSPAHLRRGAQTLMICMPHDLHVRWSNLKDSGALGARQKGALALA